MTKGKITIVMLFVLVALLVGLSCYGQDKPVACSDMSYVSLIQLISNPDKFHGKLVRFIGFVNLEFEGDAIYIYMRMIIKTGLQKMASG